MKKCNRYIAVANRVIASNIWLLDDGDGRRFLIDCGHSLERFALKRALWRARIRVNGDLDAVLLTHRHSDHAGNAAWLRDRFGCPVICHENDAPILSGKQPAPKLQRDLGTFYDKWMCRLEDRHPAICPVDDVYTDGPWRWGFTMYKAFGHTEGSSLLFHEPTRSLFSGDAILAGIPAQRIFEYLGLAVAAYSLDVKLCHRLTLDFLADPPPIDHLCSGHGPFIQRKTAQKLQGFWRKKAALVS